MDSRPIKILKDLLLNLGAKEPSQLFYIVENADWIISRMGKDITENMRSLRLLQAHTTTTPWGLKKQIIHFGSLHTFFAQKGFLKLHSSNKIVLSCFHLMPLDPRIKWVKKAAKYVDFFHTSCQSTKERLLQFGLPSKKIITIPLGVDLNLFQPVSVHQKLKIREALGLPQKRLIIGSFQKDGIGWGQGLQPKLIKGPDIFLQTVTALKKYKPFILLTGPSRGYVKQGLTRAGIPYKHFYLKNYADIGKMYNALDLYLITSRIEGGPSALLEAWASGVPIVSTAVGMVPDLAKNTEDILLAEPTDIKSIVAASKKMFRDQSLREKIIRNALRKAQQYGWPKIIRRYYQEIYAQLL
ncbi:MAG: group 1 glycosyl transferase [Parcubacteria group bacterium LiPW_72]|nr:MAG: group 1 glycosyl transferase [Parcubacteria group bacterium LiPW_72]